MTTFQNSPRDFALELVENGLTSADHLALCCLKYMSHDDVRDMLRVNDLSPATCDDCDEEIDNDVQFCADCQREHDIEAYIDEHDDGEHDTEGMRVDIENGNLEVGDDAGRYEHTSIVRGSFTNGQFTQARNQCDSFELDYDEELAAYRSDNPAT